MAQERGAEILAPASLETQFDQKQALKDKIFKLQDWLFSLPRFLRLSMQCQVFSICTPGF